jgi:hypothetical protein
MKQLQDITEWSHFSAVVNGNTIIGRKVNDRVAICQNFTSNDKDWSAPVEFGLNYYHIRTFNQDTITRYKKDGWFNENFYKVYDRYERILKLEKQEAA